jgi:type VI secretion system protein VasG
MSDVLATRLSNWSDKERPRGVFLLGGPTGVGKTETAVQLAQILSGKPNNLIRINCNVLQSTGSQKTSIIWQLLGVPQGFVGHGEGGLLTPIMEKPNAVVLFDEFEKADPSVGKLLLQIIDTGLQDDNMGNTLDFRRSIILFTSNLGVDYGSKTKRIGFGDTKPKKSIPKVDEEKLRSELKLMGYGPEFLARVHEIFLYKSLDGDAISKILKIQVEKLKEIFKVRKLNLIPKPDFTKTLATYYDPRNGVRGIINYLQTEVTAQMGKLDRMGKLKRISVVSLVMQAKDDDSAQEYSIDDDALTVFIKPPTN